MRQSSQLVLQTFMGNSSSSHYWIFINLLLHHLITTNALTRITLHNPTIGIPTSSSTSCSSSSGGGIAWIGGIITWARWAGGVVRSSGCPEFWHGYQLGTIVCLQLASVVAVAAKYDNILSSVCSLLLCLWWSDGGQAVWYRGRALYISAVGYRLLRILHRFLYYGYRGIPNSISSSSLAQLLCFGKLDHGGRF